MNEPVPLSYFGNYVDNCSNQFCKDKDGLELWLSLVNECSYGYNENNLISLQSSNNSPLFCGIVSSLFGLLCFMIGFVVSYKYTNYLVNEEDKKEYNNPNKKEERKEDKNK